MAHMHSIAERRASVHLLAPTLLSSLGHVACIGAHRQHILLTCKQQSPIHAHHASPARCLGSCSCSCWRCCCMLPCTRFCCLRSTRCSCCRNAFCFRLLLAAALRSAGFRCWAADAPSAAVRVVQGPCQGSWGTRANVQPWKAFEMQLHLIEAKRAARSRPDQGHGHSKLSSCLACRSIDCSCLRSVCEFIRLSLATSAFFLHGQQHSDHCHLECLRDSITWMPLPRSCRNLTCNFHNSLFDRFRCYPKLSHSMLPL